MLDAIRMQQLDAQQERAFKRTSRAREKLMLRAATLAYARMLDERVALAREALRRARATMDHQFGRVGERDCIGMQYDHPLITWAYSQRCEGASLDYSTGHRACASLLLDGFSVDEVTEAGG